MWMTRVRTTAGSARGGDESNPAATQRPRRARRPPSDHLSLALIFDARHTPSTHSIHSFCLSRATPKPLPEPSPFPASPSSLSGLARQLMGNGQSSPAGTHPHPPAAKVQTSHREHHRRSPSPGGAQRQQQQLAGGKPTTGDGRRGSNASSPGVTTAGGPGSGGRKKSLELPDLTRLNFTAANAGSAAGAGANGSPASSTATTTATANGSAASSPVSKPSAGSRGILGRKRPSPLAPTIMTSPLSPISPKQTTAHATSHSTVAQQQQQQQQASHNPYFPAEPPAPVSAEASPIDIPSTPSQGMTPGLPAYDRMTYAAEPLASARRQSAAGATHAHSLQPPPATRHRPSQQQQQQDVSRKTSAIAAGEPAAAPSGAKKARIAEGPPAVVPPVEPSPSSSLSPRQQQQQHRPKQPSVAGVDEDNTIRSSLPSGGDEFPPGLEPADGVRAASSSPGQGSAASPPAAAAGAASAGSTAAGGAGGMLGLSIGGNGPGGPAAASTTGAGPAASKPRRKEETLDIEAAEEGVPTIINWTGGGKEVYVCGTFAKNWKERLKMSKRCGPSRRRRSVSSVLSLTQLFPFPPPPILDLARTTSRSSSTSRPVRTGSSSL